MGVGPPRAGLRPGIGQYPGEATVEAEPEQLDASEPSETLYPSTTLYPFTRYIRRPSATIFPGIDLQISTVALQLEGALQVLSFTSHDFLTLNVVRRRTLGVESTSRVGFSYFSPSGSDSRMGVKVSLASVNEKAPLASASVRAKLASAVRRVRL